MEKRLEDDQREKGTLSRGIYAYVYVYTPTSVRFRVLVF